MCEAAAVLGWLPAALLVRRAEVAVFPGIRIPMAPDLRKVHALVVLVEKHVSAFRADQEKKTGQGAEDAPGGCDRTRPGDRGLLSRR